jgi:hypothetical protein
MRCIIDYTLALAFCFWFYFILIHVHFSILAKQYLFAINDKARTIMRHKALLPDYQD